MPNRRPLQQTRVRGELNEQFAKHYLEIRASNPNDKMTIVMDFNPNDNQSVKQFSGFIVLSGDQVNQLNNTAPRSPSMKTTAHDANESISGVVRKVANFDAGTYTLVIFNDSTVPMDYILSGQNIIFIDSSGEQVTDPSAPIVADVTEAEAAPAAATTAPTAAATTAAPVAATATPAAAATAAATTETTTVVVPGKFTATELEGELTERFAKHYYDLEVQDIKSAVEVEMTYDPQDVQDLTEKLNFYVLNDGQFRSLVNGSANNLSMNNTLVGELLPPNVRSIKTKYGRISQPFTHYVVIVSNDSTLAGRYKISVKNAILVDESAQSITAQEMSSTEVVMTTTDTTTTGTTTTGTTTATTGTPAAATATPAATTTGDGSITPPTTYRVASGDTMGTISRRAYGTSQLYAQICAFNNITNCNVIEVGQSLNIPARADLPSSTTAAAATPTPAATTAAGVTPAATTAAGATPAATAVVAQATAVPTTAASTAPASGNLVATAGSFNVLDTLGLLLDLLELEPDQNNNVKAILNGGTYTFFAPTDTAFTSLNEAQLERLIANPTELASVLKSHIVAGTINASGLTNGSTVTTLSGVQLPVTVANGVVTVGGARVVQADVAATNGVIHIIGSVLVPAQ